MFENLFSIQGLSLDRLKNFLAFADAKSIVAAAGKDSVRQSLISRQLRELGEFFGVELVRRHGRGLMLTEAGNQLAKITREHFSALDEFSRRAKSQPSILNITASNSVALWHIIPKLPEIRRQLPEVQFMIQHEQTAAMVLGVLEGRYDLGFVRDIVLPSQLKRKVLGSMGFALFVPRQLGKRVNPADPKTWLQLPLALLPGGTLRETIDRIALKNHITLQPTLICDSYAAAAAAVESGSTAAILPTLATPSLANKGIQMIQLPELHTNRPKLLLIWNQRSSATRPSVSSTIDISTEVLKLTSA